MIGICLIFSGKSFSQLNLELAVQQVGYLLNDAVLYSNKFIAPAANAIVYQTSTSWLETPQKKRLFEVNLSLHANVFFVPTKSSSFQINNSDFSFLQIENASSVIVPNGLGDSSVSYLVGNIANNPIRIETPKGINQQTMNYPYLQGTIGLWNGFELIGKYSSRVKLRKGDFQVYGLGLKHNFSQYIPKLEQKNIHLAVLTAISKEDLNFDFLAAKTPFGTLGIDRLSGKVTTFQFQLSASKEWKNFELMASSITNISNFKYFLSGTPGEIEEILPVQDILNTKLKEIYAQKMLTIAEIAGRYRFNKFFVQTSFGFGKFVNSNIAIQYAF
jgi:hypothetical protein